MIVEFSVVPIGGGVSVSEFLVPALKELERRGIRYEVTAMSTIFEAEDIKEALDAIGAAHEAIFKTGIKRVITLIRIDDRRDKKVSMKNKVESLISKIKERS
ncbi:MAG TPA: MTH1187 family thiamine-binding protein [Candidatus Bathyarchaeota archaeon]|nr:MTH1187 family thiamine-binding protein [Candidatus Bathyarchaeota archaeon]